MKIVDEDKKNDIDLVKLIEELKEKYEAVYWQKAGDFFFIYKPLGRRDYKEIAENESLNALDKEDEVIKRCILYPKDIDLDNIEAGIVSKMFKIIIENSYMDSEETRRGVMEYFRSEMFDFENQVPCIINEAFPQYDIEEIENWGVERTAKYLSRAEFKLQNFRGMQFNYDVLNQMQQKEAQQQDLNENNKQEIVSDDASQSKSNQLDAKKLAELKRKFPEINWEDDAVLTGKNRIEREEIYGGDSFALRPID